MDKAGVLCMMDRAMMEAFSRRTAEALARHTLFGLLLPAFQSFLNINVRKEIEKDRRVIAAAATALRADRAPDAADVTRLLTEARDVDQAFLREATPFPLNLRIRYEDVEPARRQRIERLLELSHRLLASWQSTKKFRSAAAAVFTRTQFRAAQRDILRLYALETRMLGNSVSLPRLFTPARAQLAATIYSVMETVAEELAGECTGRSYQPRS